MSAPQITRTPAGEELVVLPRAEYETLLARADPDAEDADDIATHDARKAELAASGGCAAPRSQRRDPPRRKSPESHSQLARRDPTAFEFQDEHRSGLSVRSRKWAPYGNPRDHREARKGVGCTCGVAFVDQLYRMRPRAKPIWPGGIKGSSAGEWRLAVFAHLACSATIWMRGRIASPELLLDIGLLPHLICSRRNRRQRQGGELKSLSFAKS